MANRRALVWLRRDLRLSDNTALAAACTECESVAVAFVLSPTLLRSDRMGAPIVQFFFSALDGLRTRLRDAGSDLILLEGDFKDELLSCSRRIGADALYFNRDTDPAAIRRDDAVTEAFAAAGHRVAPYDDLVYFAADAVTQGGGKPYTVFTPYKRRWLAARDGGMHAPVSSERPLQARLVAHAELGSSCELPAPEDYGHTSSALFPTGNEKTAKAQLKTFLAHHALGYGDQRNYPALDATSRLSPHLRAGTIGIRTCVETAFHARESATPAQRTQLDVWIGELIWRDFYHQILVHFPHVADGPFDERGKRIAWRDDEKELTAWCDGMTGYPIVDAAMRQLNSTGWMHNRLRMIVASFLTKDLLIDWRRGERYFEQHLADGDLAANNGGWQWTASTGTDSAPYFRVFNPVTQSTNFDPDGAFLRKMLPELSALNSKTIHAPWTALPLLATSQEKIAYPAPIVDHAIARQRTLDAFSQVFGRTKPLVKP